ncbi:MAG: hypothetical protein JOZ18_02535 [Chloroflexi bacterium]|nr:hypothetical protein [Chloroflexota bacterium]
MDFDSINSQDESAVIELSEQDLEQVTGAHGEHHHHHEDDYYDDYYEEDYYDYHHCG